jgi:leucyl aminopeptidase
VNKNFENEVTFAVINKRGVIYSPTGPLNRDYDDVRRITDAANVGFERLVKTGAKKPLLINCVKDKFEQSAVVSILGALHAVHIPLEVREAKNLGLLKVDHIGFLSEKPQEDENNLLKIASAIEIGRIVTRDIGGTDPERMSAIGTSEYVKQVLKNTTIRLNEVEGQKNFEKDYPCFAAVNRAASSVPRHQGRIIKLVYSPVDHNDSTPIEKTLFLIGKGINYDTGGADIKAGGFMAGMHRDKCGAAFVAGFFKTLSLLKPKGIEVYGFMSMARNSVGEECYVADEIITSRAGCRVRIGNTDAEGRMAMVDVLCEAKEIALNKVNPHLFTIATLTGHVIRAYGDQYSATMSNGPGVEHRMDSILQQVGHHVADPFEISTLRRDDFDCVAGRSEYEDVLQATNKASSAEPRGHQFPAAFMIRASGLENHGNDSNQRIPYTHIDIAGSSGPFPGKPTGSPLPAFTYAFVLPKV